MTVAFVAAAILGQPAAQDPVDLNRTFKAGEKLTYEFNSRISLDFREAPFETFIPQTDSFTYTFTLENVAMKPDGVADIRFSRPKVVLKQGETFESPPKDIVLVKEQIQLMTVSRKNQLLGVKDESPKKPEKPPLKLLSSGAGERFGPQIEIGGWIGQMRSLAAFVNFFDMGPILPGKPVSEGDTWKETVGYAPITLQTGADKGKNVVRRVDYVYTFKGRTQTDGKPSYHVQGRIEQDTDAAPYVADILGVKLDRSPFKEIRLKMDGTVDYYLAADTLQVLNIRATSQGSVDVTVSGYPGPVYEERFRSRASLVRK